MSTMTRAQQLKQLIPGIKALFGLEYNRYPDEFKSIYETESSEKAFEEMVKLVGFGVAKVTREGEAYNVDWAGEAWPVRFDHEKVTTGFKITEEAVDDNLYRKLTKDYVKLIARSMAYTKNIKAFSPINNGFSTYKTGDGVSFFNAQHPLANGGFNANAPVIAADLNETSLEDALNTIGGWTDERGLMINAKAKTIHIHRNNRFAAQRLLMSELRPGGELNDVNVHKLGSKTAELSGYEVNQWLVDPDAWFIHTDVPMGLMHFERKQITHRTQGDFDTGNIQHNVSERYVFGVNDPLCMYGNPGA